MVNKYTIAGNKQNGLYQRSVKNKHQMRYISIRLCNLSVSLALLLFPLLISGCSSAESDWEEASKIDTIASYKKYIENYPESAQKDNAIQKLLTKALPLSFELITKHNFSEAKSLLKIALSVDPGNPLALNNLGLILAQENENEKAISSLKAAIPRAKEQRINNIAYLFAFDYGSKGTALYAFQPDTSNMCYNSGESAKHGGERVTVALLAGEGICVCLLDPRDKRTMGYGIDRPITLDLVIGLNISRLNE